MNDLIKLATGILLLSALITACGDKNMELAEARKVALAYQGESFTPPARTLDDILQAINSASDRPRPCRLCQQDDDSASGFNEQLDLLSHKGIAYNRIGNTEEALRYTRKAIDLLESGDARGRSIGWKARILVYNRAMQVNEALGDYSQGIAYGEKSRVVLDSGAPQGKAGARTFLLSSLALHYARLGQLDEAKSALKGAEENFVRVSNRFGPGDERWAHWNGALVYARAHIDQAEGELARAEGTFREAIRWFEREVQGKNFRQNQLLIETRGLYLVEVLLEQGRSSEAELESRKAIRHSLDYFGRYSPATASAIMGLSKVMLKSGRYKDAQTLAEISLDILGQLNATGGSSYVVQARNLQADALLAQGLYAEALDVYRRNEVGAKGHARTLKSFIKVNLNYAIALMHEGDLERAETIASAAETYRRDVLGDGHPAVSEARALVSLIRARKDNSPDAIRSLQELIPAIAESLSDGAADQISAAAALQRFRLFVDGYLRLVADDASADYGQIESMFQIAQLGRSQTVQKALSASAVRHRASNPALAELIRQEQDLAFKIDAAYQAILRRGDQASGKASNLAQDAGQLARALASIRAEISSAFPQYETLRHPRPVSFSQLQAELRAGEVLISFYFAEDRGYLWVIPGQGAASMQLVELDRADLNEMVGQLRQTFNSNARSIAEIPAFDLSLSHRLYQRLLQPSEALWREAETLTVVADGALAALPLGTLVISPPMVTTDERLVFDHYRKVDWLANRHAFAYVPSERALLSLRKLPPGKPGRQLFAGFGNPLFGDARQDPQDITLRNHGFTIRGLRKTKSGDLDSPSIASTKLGDLLALPETEAELTEVARTLGADVGQSVYVGERATEDQVKRMALDKRKVIMFATHALIPGDLDGLEQPALALSSPSRTGSGGDGLLTMSEILDLKLDTDWVVLSACNTGAASGRGADAISGLGMAFFYAGSRALLVSHWPVETLSARAMTTSVFKLRSEKGLNRDQAIHAAKRRIRDEMNYTDPKTGRALFAYAHPLFWSPFTLVGNGN